MFPSFWVPIFDPQPHVDGCPGTTVARTLEDIHVKCHLFSCIQTSIVYSKRQLTRAVWFCHTSLCRCPLWCFETGSRATADLIGFVVLGRSGREGGLAKKMSTTHLGPQFFDVHLEEQSIQSMVQLTLGSACVAVVALHMPLLPGVVHIRC